MRQKGKTALMFASMTGHTEVVKLLLAAGADVNAKRKASQEEETTGDEGILPTAYISRPSSLSLFLSEGCRYLEAHHQLEIRSIGTVVRIRAQ